MRPHMAKPSSTPPPSNAAADRELLRSLLRLARDISLFDSLKSVFQRRNVASLSRRSNLLAALFEDLLRSDTAPRRELPRSVVICLTEILAVLRRFLNLLDTCAIRMSRVRLALQFDAVSDEFRDLFHDLATLLDILPLSDLEVSDDVRELVDLVKVQCRKSDAGPAASALDPAEVSLRSEVLNMIYDIEREIVPERSRLEEMFDKLGLGDPQSCKDEISRLEIEIRDGAAAGKWSAAMISLLGLVRYAKCVLFGASTPRRYSAELIVRRSFSSSSSTSFSSSETAIPSDFRCPISLELMRDPVVVATGQTYDRNSITRWIDAGHATCPKTGQALAHTGLVSNRALKNLIDQWCREQNVPFEATETTAASSATKHDVGVGSNKAALEAAKMTALFLVQKLSGSQSSEASNRIVHELRQLAKTGSENRAFIAEAGAVPLLLPLLVSDDPSLQVNAITALLNLSILDDNKKRIMKAPEGIARVVDVLVSGATWQARENAGATLLSLSALHSLFRRRIGKEARVAEGLADLVRTGPTSSKRDGLITILNLAGARENIGRLVEGGVIVSALEAIGTEDIDEMAVAVLAAMAKRGAAKEVGATAGFVPKMIAVMRQGTDLAKEAAAAALVSVCRMGGTGPVAELAETPGLEWLIWGLMGSGSVRARRKAASLGRISRRWAACRDLEQNHHHHQQQQHVGMSSISVVVPAQSCPSV